MDHIHFLSSLNVNTLRSSSIAELTPADLIYYIPLFLKVLKDIPVDVVQILDQYMMRQQNTDISLRTLLFFLFKTKVLVPTTNTIHWCKMGTEEDKATASFFDSLPKASFSEGTTFTVHMSDPLFGIPIPISQVKVLRTFSSQAKPSLLELTYDILPPKHLIYKNGDNLTLDLMVQTMFYLFNKLWASSSAFAEDTPFIYQYLVLPTGKDQGVVEFVRESTSVEKFNWQRKVIGWVFNSEEIGRLICSAAGGFVGSFVLGIRDRHRDNMMVKEDGTFFHIDFAYLFNKETWFDANRFAIPTEIKLLLKDRWPRFLGLCADAYIILRRNSSLLTHFCTKLFSGVFPEALVRECLVTAFQVNLSEDEARENIRAMVASGEASNKKKLKDTWHKFTKKS